MAKIIEGKIIADRLHQETATMIAKHAEKPHLGVILVGNNKASERYVKHKQIAAEKIGILCTVFRFDEDISQIELEKSIQSIQKNHKLDGCIVQLPLPDHLDRQSILDTINPEKDIDCLTTHNMGKLMMGTSPFIPPTVAAVIHIIENEETIDVREKHIVIVGAGILVGKPLSMLMLQKEATVTVCNKYTKNLDNLTRNADILVTAVGRKDLIKADMIKEGAVVIDVGVSFEGKKIYGDAEFEAVSKKAASITPTPGGVGPLTIAFLLRNTLIAMKNTLS